MQNFFDTFRLAVFLVGLFYLGRMLFTGRIESRMRAPILRAKTPADFWIVWGVMVLAFAGMMAGLYLIGR
jgi:hypothetical protein